MHQLATSGQQESGMERGTVKSHREELPEPEVSRGLPQPARVPDSHSHIPRHRSKEAQWARGCSCNSLSF